MALYVSCFRLGRFPMHLSRLIGPILNCQASRLLSPSQRTSCISHRSRLALFLLSFPNKVTQHEAGTKCFEIIAFRSQLTDSSFRQYRINLHADTSLDKTDCVKRATLSYFQNHPDGHVSIHATVVRARPDADFRPRLRCPIILPKRSH